LHVDDVARRFGKRWAVARVTLHVPRGGALMITGANGSGKTTLLRCIATALRPDHGAIRWNGRDVWNERAAVRGDIAYYSHAPRLYDDLSAAENLRVWARLGGLDVDIPGALAKVGLPNDRKDAVRTFSAGMRRRLAWAVALLKKPQLALLDEPFTALDPEGRYSLIERVLELRRAGTTLVVATHLPRLSSTFCSEAIHLDAGRIAWRGAPSEAPAGGDE
jgi:heme exporter protein A